MRFGGVPCVTPWDSPGDCSLPTGACAHGLTRATVCPGPLQCSQAIRWGFRHHFPVEVESWCHIPAKLARSMCSHGYKRVIYIRGCAI